MYEGGKWYEARRAEADKIMEINQERKQKSLIVRSAPASARTRELEKQLEDSRQRDLQLDRVRKEFIERMSKEDARLVYEALCEHFGESNVT